MLLRGHVGITAQGKCKDDSQLEGMMALIGPPNMTMSSNSFKTVPSSYSE